MDNLPQIRMLNDPESTEMWIAGAIRDYSRLGADIGENTHVETLRVNTNAILNRAADNGFLDGIKRNTSIRNLSMMTVNNIYQVGGVAHEVLNVYKENNRLARLVISWCSLQNGTDNVITETLRGCSNLTKFSLTRSSLSDAQLLPMIEVLRGHNLLEELLLGNNRIGNDGCNALTSLLEDPNCNLLILNISDNPIGCEGMVSIANALARNNRLRRIEIGGRNDLSQTDETLVEDAFDNLLENKSSINSTYASNHTPEQYGLPWVSLGMMDNCHPNKSHVAIKKILNCHPNIDMRPMFNWDSEGERNLKALPYVISWFAKAEEAVSDDNGGDNYHMHSRKLSAIYQFARAMPLLVIPVSHNKVDEEKRKRNEL